MELELKNYYLKEFQYFNEEYFITLNIVDINTKKMIITLAVSNQGKVSVIDYDLLKDNEDNLYFQYGIEKEEIKVDEFETIID